MNILISDKFNNPNNKKLKVDKDNNVFIIFYSKDGSMKETTLKEFLGLDSEEQDIVFYYESLGFTLIGEKNFNESYPEYITNFISTNKNLIVDGQEKGITRINQVDRKIIFIKLKQKINKEIKNTIVDFSTFVSNILENKN